MNKSKRKFQLSRESIRVLTSGQLNRLVGGGTLASLYCSVIDDCPFPSHGPCSNPCAQSDGLRCI
jgi:hypothetical protein